VREETDRFIEAHVRRGRAIFERFTHAAAEARP